MDERIDDSDLEIARMRSELVAAISKREAYLYKQLAVRDERVKRLEDKLRKHIHTSECWHYAVKTASHGAGAYCMADCADSHRDAMPDKTQNKEH